MNKNEVMHEYAKELEKRIRLQTFPLAVKLLESEADIPKMSEKSKKAGMILTKTKAGTGETFKEPVRPLRDLGYKIALCQGFAISRKEGLTIAMFAEDMLCFEPIVGYGWAKMPKYFLDGNNRYPQDVKSLEAGKNYARDFPTLNTGKYKGVISAPLEEANFEPDAILLYCDSEQLNLLLLAAEHENGHDLSCNLSSHAACVYSVVPIIKGANYQVSIPCRGDRYFALTSASKIIFSIPGERLNYLIEALRYLEKYNYRLPKLAFMVREPVFPQSYVKLLKMVTKDKEE